MSWLPIFHYPGCAPARYIVLDEKDKVLYSELVQEITHEPNYDAALTAARFISV